MARDRTTVKLRSKVGRYAGEIIEYPKSVAENLLMTGQAEYPDGRPSTQPVETATTPEPEKASTPAPETATTPEPEKATKTKESKASAEWDLKMSPEEYLERYPDGPNADAAREALGE